MAATAVYFVVRPIARGDGKDFLPPIQSFSNISSTSSTFSLTEGRYMLECVGATFGTVTLQVLGPDSSTYLTAATAFAANGTLVVDLPHGTYKVTLA